MKKFDKFNDASLWASNLAEAIVNGGFWACDEIMIEHQSTMCTSPVIIGLMIDAFR